VPAARVVETHTALLFFVGDHVYKLKKAVDLGFLDHRDREARLATCRHEVDLNRRLAPDVYLGVLDIVGEDGKAIDHLVHMRRMPEDRRLTRLVERGEDVEPALRAVAHAIAALHEQRGTDPRHDRNASLPAVSGRWTEGFDQLRSLPVGASARALIDETEQLAGRYLAGREPLFVQRIADGRIRDGHGDLQADDIFVLDDGPRILDCIEFGEDYRWGDVLSDVAFLAMDLERLGRPDLGQWFLQLHRELSADRWPSTLAHHYVAYRAHIRAKVGIVRSAQQGEPAGPAVSRYLDLSRSHLRDAQVQILVVGGAPGTGKSTVAAALGDRLGAVVLRTDEVRQRVPVGEGLARYAPEAVMATYLQTLLEARRLVGLGEHVILDATWSSAAHRELARRATEDTSCDLVEICCTLSRDEADARIRARQAQGADASEATVEVAAELAARFEPWPEATELSTRGTPESVADRAWTLVSESRARSGS
jgi:aminoglycoside phosphotransferase family enzyme/predicted kinase